MKRSVLYSIIAFATSSIFLLTIPSGMATSYSTTTVVQPITVELDKDKYNRDDIMIVSGEVKKVATRVPLTIQIMDPTGNLVHVEQIEVASDGKFTVPVKVGGPTWALSGNYTLIAQYGFKHIVSSAKFYYEETETPVTGMFNVKEKPGGQNFDLNYSITGGKVNNMYLEPKDLALVVLVDTKDYGVLHISIPRLMLDAKSDNTDETFLVYVNEDERNTFTEENSSSTSRVLDIPLSPGDTKVEIIGTTVIPEFSSLAGMVIVMAIIGSIIISKKLSV
ncbi:MAG: hypothetical protein KGI28_08725 [Thaumarchaeota archaeon]|nr:hypothetical protein [Nitrososphaerota archaeon]